MNEQFTIKQIADMAGVSVASVSYALNGKKGISEKTRERILDVIQNTNYTPNVNSRRLILQKSFNILLVFESDDSPFDDFFRVEVMSSVVECCAELGYNTVLVKLTDSFEFSALKNTLLQHNADGIIFFGDISRELSKNIEEIGTPFVIIDSQTNDPRYPNIHTNYVEASYSAVKHLIENGHKRIAMLDMGNSVQYFVHTSEGYKTALQKSSIRYNPEWVKTDVHSELDVEKYVNELLSGEEVPTAFFCSSDFIAINLMNCLQRKGHTLPNDFSVCSIDDTALARYHFPSLTTISVDKTFMGRMAVQMLNRLINGDETQTSIETPFTELVKRDSVKKIN